MKLKKYLYMLLLGTTVSCTNLDIPPVNILSEKDIYGTHEGAMTVITTMYRMMPMEDFRYCYTYDQLFNYPHEQYFQFSCLTGEALGRDSRGAGYEHSSIAAWNGMYALIRDINLFIEKMPAYEFQHSAANYKAFMGEARFVRAFTYYALVKRFGGVPLVDKVIDYPASVDYNGTKLYRASEEQIWDFIASDLDYAIATLPQQATSSGRVNKYAAAALKSRAMLHAGSIAKYNTVSEEYTGARICGVPAVRAKDYFKAAYEAAKIVDGGGYGLYKGSWVAGDKVAQAKNFEEIFWKNTNENILVKYFKKPDYIHNYDEAPQPTQTKGGGTDSEACPTLDFIELFDGIDKNTDGTFANFDNNSKYKLFDSPLDAFNDCEPRLRATVILPMDMFKNQSIELRRGIWKGAAAGGISAIPGEGSIGNYADIATSDMVLASSFSTNTPVSIKGGRQMTPSGVSGPVSNWDLGNISGFYLRKYLDKTPNASTRYNSSQHWIEMRYAEVLLNKAEAAYELTLLGESNASTGESYKTVAFSCINDIRERAGAIMLNDESELSNIDIIRIERRKELAFENKTYWDLKRWRILDDEQNNKRYRILMPFYADDAGKYFFSIKYQEPRAGVNYIFTYDSKYYYQPIPGEEIIKNHNCKQNPGF